MAEQKNTAEASGEISPDLVRKVADEVYALLLRELQIENERRRVLALKSPYKQGGC